MGEPALFFFAGGGTLAGLRWQRLLADGSAPTNLRVLLRGEPPATVGDYDDDHRRLWDVYRRDGTDPRGRPLFRFQGQETTGT